MTKKDNKLIGEYIREERLGRGSFASVYKGRHKVTNDIVAIKDIYIEKMPEKNLQAEINIMREMSHPCIVKLIDCIRTRTHVYLVMEYCSLGDMNTFLKSTNKGMSEQDLIHFLDQMASALKYLRQHNFVHRDIKPQNILLVPSNDGSLPNIKISDFGFAKFLPNTDLTSSYCGTPLYMAPEVLSRKSYDSKADLWSLGVLLYEMMMGKKMIETNQMYELQDFLQNYNHHQLDFTSGHYQFSTELTDLISVLLKKNPIKRASCEDFFHHVQLLKAKEHDDYVVIVDVAEKYPTCTPPLEESRHRKFSMGSASSVLTKAFSKASTKIFGSEPPSPLTPPMIDSQTILVEEMTLEKLLIPDDASEINKMIEIITAVEFYASQKWTATDCLLTREETMVLSFKVASLLKFTIKKMEHSDKKKLDWLKERYQVNIQHCGRDFKTDLSVEKLLYDKALELSRAAAVKQLIHEELNCCIFQYQQSILILEAIIIDDTQNVGIDDEIIIKTLINSIQTRLDRVMTHL